MVVSAAAAYRLWAPSYDTDPNPLLALEERIVRDLVPCVCSKLVVDVGCGTGRSMVRYRQRGGLTFGADPCPEMLAEARKKPGLSKRLVQADASYLPFPDEIADVTICSFALSYFQELPQSLSELSRVTKRSGRVVISDLHSGAVAAGWTRSFRVGSNKYEIAHVRHPEETILSAYKNAGLQVVAQKDAAFGEPERAIFASAGKAHVFSMLIGKPAVRVIVCNRI